MQAHFFSLYTDLADVQYILNVSRYPATLLFISMVRKYTRARKLTPRISYPVFVSDGSPFEESVNDLLVEQLCWGQDEEKLRDYKGCQIIDGSYSITFANEDMVSICLHLYGIQGMGPGLEYWKGVTFSISEQRFLHLSDFCTWEDLVQYVGTPEDLLKRMPEEKIGQYVADELPSEISWDKDYNFYLGPDYVGLMLLNRAASSQENWMFEVPFDWTSKEYTFSE